MSQGDTLYRDANAGGIELRAGDPDFEAEMEIAARVMRKDRAILRELAK